MDKFKLVGVMACSAHGSMGWVPLPLHGLSPH